MTGPRDLLLISTVVCALGLAITNIGSADPSPEDKAKGTATCEKLQQGKKRKILKCWENIELGEARKLCYKGYGGDSLHHETNGPTCFAIINGDVPWP